MLLKKPIPIHGRRKINPATVEEALCEVNGRATAHVIRSHRDLAAIAIAAEKDLENRGLSKSLRDGTRLTYVPTGPGSSYARKANHAITTKVVLERLKGTWCLVEVERAEIFATSSESKILELTSAAIAAILRHATRDTRLRDAPPRLEHAALGPLLFDIAQVVLPEDMSAHRKLAAVGIVDNLIDANSSR